MDSFSTDTLLSSGHLTRFRDSSCNVVPALQPALTRVPPSSPWRTGSDSDESSLFALITEANCPRIKFARDHPLQGRGSVKLLYTDPTNVYPSPPSSSSTSKNTIPLPEEAGEFASVYSTHLAGVLDSPPVMRRQDLASQKPLTPPPTMPHPTLNLPDADVDMPFVDEQLEEEEAEFEDDESSFSLSGSSPPSAQSDLPLSPLSPSWDSPCTQALSVASSQELSESEQPNALFSSCDVSPTPACRHISPSSHEPSSLLEVDAPCPLFAPISFPWSPDHHHYDAEQDSTSSTTSFSSSPSLTDYDELPPPSSPLISRLDLPDLGDEGMPQIIPSSPSRRSCSCLPDSDIDMADFASDSALSSSGHQLLSLPGAETDDDLIPTLPAPAPFVPFTPSQPLLLIDDPRDMPLPRSPSPEDFDFCFSPEDVTDPELTKLFDLRKRSIAAERAARREASTDQSDLFKRAEARKTQKRERERSKEVGALIRLKLGDGIPTCPQAQSPEREQQNHPRSRGVIGSISQLIAQMVFRRSETSRSFSKRKSVIASREYVRSSLSHAIVSGE